MPIAAYRPPFPLPILILSQPPLQFASIAIALSFKARLSSSLRLSLPPSLPSSRPSSLPPHPSPSALTLPLSLLRSLAPWLARSLSRTLTHTHTHYTRVLARSPLLPEMPLGLGGSGMDGYMSVYTQFLTFDNAASTTMVKYRQAELGHTEANGPTDGDNYGRGENIFQLDGLTDERVI